MIIQTILMVCAAILIVVYAHEVGRGGKNIKFNKYFPPVITSTNRKYKYGGIAVNFAIAYAIFYLKPEMFFVQIIGLIAWKHFIYYNILGLLKQHFPKHMTTYSFFNEITRKQMWWSIPAVIGSYFLFREYYIPIAIKLFEIFL